MPNDFSYLMLLAWPLVALALFVALPLSKALIWTILGGYLILPTGVGIKFPMVPMIDKFSVPTVSAAVLCLIFAPPSNRFLKSTVRQSAATVRRGRALLTKLLILLLVVPFLSVLNNSEPIVLGQQFIPGLRLYDSFSIIAATLISVLPFLLAYRYLTTQNAHRDIVAAFALAGLIYSLPVLFEVRMSPQLHAWVYGFFPHSFLQHVREGGFRPIVFLSHGLLVGMLLSISILASLTLWRETLRQGRPAKKWLFLAIGLAITLILSKNLGAVAITACLGMVAAFGGRRLQTATTMLVALVVLLYPMLRATNFIPVNAIHEIARSISEDRAQSLKYRLDNEDALLARANEKPLSGWGSWGRNHIYDPETGRVLSITDGMWIIVIGMYGWIGYIAHFGLLTLPLFFSTYRREPLNPSLIASGLGLILSAILIDMLPNAGLVPYVWMLAGALTGSALKQHSEQTGHTSQPATIPAGVLGRANRSDSLARLSSRLATPKRVQSPQPRSRVIQH